MSRATSFPVIQQENTLILKVWKQRQWAAILQKMTGKIYKIVAKGLYHINR